MNIGGDFINSGLIHGDAGVYVYFGTLSIGGDFINSGTIIADDGDAAYLYQTTIGGDLINSGTMIVKSSSSMGIALRYGSVGGSIINSGLIDTNPDAYDGIYVYNSTIGGDIHNTSSGFINSGEVGIYIYGGSVGGSIINDGTIHGTDDYHGMQISATVIGGSIKNTGLIRTRFDTDEGDFGIYVYSTVVLGDIHNTSTGVIDAEETGLYVYLSTVAGSIINDGTIITTDLHGIYIYQSSVGGSVSNTGTIIANENGIYIYQSSVGGSVSNTGLLVGDELNAGDGYGLYVYTSVVGSVSNSGTIIGGIYIVNNSTDSFFNSGIVSTRLNNSETDSYTQTADGIFRFDATNAATYGDLTVDDQATFAAGSGIQVGLDPAHTIVAGDTLADVITAGTLSASTFTVGDNVLSLSFSAVIDGNTVDLTAANTGLTTILAATLAAGYGGGAGAATVLDTLLANDPFGEFAFGFGSLSTEQEIANGVESVVPVLSGGLAQASHVIGSAFTDVVGGRQDAQNGISSGDEYFVDGNMWLKPFGGWTEQDDRDGVSGYDIDSYGIAFGMDGVIPSSSWSIGAAFAYINSDVDSDMDITFGSQDVDVDTFLGKIYASYKLDDVTAINLQGGVGKSDYDSKRVDLTGAVARADYDSTHYLARAEVVRSYKINAKTSVSPYIHVDYINVDVDDYVETGGGSSNLTVDDDSNDSVIFGVGVKSAYDASDKLLLTGKVGVGYDFAADSSSLTSSFAGGWCEIQHSRNRA